MRALLALSAIALLLLAACSPDEGQVVVFGLLIAVLIFRPDGLLARPAVDRLPGAGGARW